MKQTFCTLTALAAIVFLLSSAPALASNGTVEQGGVCTTLNDCAGNLTCTGGFCDVDPSLTIGTGADGQACQADSDCTGSGGTSVCINSVCAPDDGTIAKGDSCADNTGDCRGELYCSPSNVCAIDPSLSSGLGPTVTSGTTGAAVPLTTANNTTSGFNSSTCTSSDGFTSLSCISGFVQAEGAGDLTAFFNAVYLLCIGAAAVIAVLQITRAGILYMGSDSVGNKDQAKHLISMSLIGLALVLSPVLIFNLINPGIDNFSVITKDAQSLTISQTTALNGGASAATSATPAGATNIPCDTGGNTGDCTNQAAACNTSAPRTEVCLKSDGSVDPNYTLSTGQVIGSSVGITANLTCPSGETLNLQCTANSTNNPGTGVPPANGCNATTPGQEYQQVSCGTDSAATAWSQQYCNGGGEVTQGICTGGAGSTAGSCASGQYPQVFCAGSSPQSYIFSNATGQMIPLANQKSAVDTFVNGCKSPAGQLCFPSYAPPSSLDCPDGSAGPCYTSKLLCTNSTSENGCINSNQFILNDR